MKYLIAKCGTLARERILHTGGRLKVGEEIRFVRHGDSYWAERKRARIYQIVRDEDGTIEHLKLEW